MDGWNDGLTDLITVIHPVELWNCVLAFCLLFFVSVFICLILFRSVFWLFGLHLAFCFLFVKVLYEADTYLMAHSSVV